MPDIQRDLMEKGPVTVGMMVYEDFELYAGGISKTNTTPNSSLTLT